MRKPERSQIGERKHIYSKLSDEALFLETGIPFGMAMQRAVERQLSTSESRMEMLVASVQETMELVLATRKEEVQPKKALVSTRALSRDLGVSRATIYRWRRQEDFPKPLQLGNAIR